MKIIFEFSLEKILSRCLRNINRSNTTIYEDLYESFSFFINPSNDLTSLINKVNHKYRINNYDPHVSLIEYIEHDGICFKNIIIELYYSKDSNYNINEIGLPYFIKYDEPPKYGLYQGPYSVKHVVLKTIKKTIIKFESIVFDKSFLIQILQQINQDYSILLPSKLGPYEWRQTFYHKITGDVFFCECFKQALAKQDEFTLKPNHIHLIKGLANPVFKKGICHLCTGKNSDLEFCHPMYGSIFRIKYGAYIEKIRIEKSIEGDEAENIVRELKGFPRLGEKWLNETLLYNYVVLLFSNYKVIREASPEWLGKQRLDIFIPDLKLAIEYQGEQHFKEVKLFGGADGLKKTIERDVEKAQKCKKNNIDLIYFSYKDELTEKLVLDRLYKYYGIDNLILS